LCFFEQVNNNLDIINGTVMVVPNVATSKTGLLPFLSIRQLMHYNQILHWAGMESPHPACPISGILFIL